MEDLISIVNRLNEHGVSFHSFQETITMKINQPIDQEGYQNIDFFCLQLIPKRVNLIVQEQKEQIELASGKSNL